MKVSELVGPTLDFWVAKAEELDDPWFKNEVFGCVVKGKRYAPSTDWTQGGPIIEREKIESYYFDDHWRCAYDIGGQWRGETNLIAAMRCLVASKFGDIVDDSQAD